MVRMRSSHVTSFVTVGASILLNTLIASEASAPPAMRSRASGIPTAGQSIDHEIQQYIEQVSAAMRDSGKIPFGEPTTGGLTADESLRFTVETETRGREGVEYVAVGVCDASCSDLDLTLYDSGGVLDYDYLPDDMPILEFTSPASERLTVEVDMVECQGSCDWGVQLYVDSSAQTDGDSSPPPTGAVSRRLMAHNHAGRLESGDSRLPTGQFADEYFFDGEAGSEVVVDLSSPDFDTYLAVRGPNGDVWTNDDFEGDRARSVVRLILPVSGKYVVTTTSYPAEESASIGEYALTIEYVEPAGDTNIEGDLTETDRVSFDGQYQDTHELEWASGDHVVVDLHGDFDTYLSITEPDFVRV